MLSRDLRDAGYIRVSAPQGAVHLLHCAEVTVSARAHAEMLFTALAQRALRRAERRRDASHGEDRFSSEEVLELGQDVSMSATGCRFLLHSLRQTLDQLMQQLLLQPMRGLKVDEGSGACLRHPDGSPVEVAQLCYRCPRRSPARCGRNGETGPGQGATVLGKLLIRRVNSAPVTGADGSCVQPLTWAERDHLASSDLDSAPDRRWSSVDRKRDQDHARRHRDKGNPCELFFDRRELKALEPNLGQSRAELAAAGDQQPGYAVGAQSRLKILRFTKYRRAAARHCSHRCA